ncbi:MAG TPA: DUF192 domain-containing protein [Candidatus Polarisedimenticolia bacterium]|nr:DUF192 domain-containing protein [Candidatus Polarisedimenticolia bacterium]
MNSKRTARVLCLLLSGATALGRGKEPPGPRAIAPNGREFVLEIAKTREKRAHGYMERSRVGPGEGMLFIFPDSDFHTFWMKNCLVSLDILWLGDDLSVVHLEHDVPACRRDPCPSYPSMSKARYVLELRAGMAKKSRLRIGEKIRLKGIDLDKVEVER